MPKIIDYTGRFESVREAVFDLTLRDGVAGITPAAVATYLAMSESTLRRMMSSTDRLPELGLRHVETRERRILFGQRADRFSTDNPEGVAANNLLQLVPRTEDRRKVAQVRRLLTLGFAHSGWAQAAASSEQLHLASLVDRVVPDALPAETRTYEAVRLTALVLGTIEAVCTEAILPTESEPMVVRHLASTFPAWLSERRTGAA